MKMMKMTILTQEEQIKTLGHENMKLNNEIDNIRRENEIMNRQKHMDVNNYCNCSNVNMNYNTYQMQNSNRDNNMFVSSNVEY
jgi:hypothetical protein